MRLTSKLFKVGLLLFVSFVLVMSCRDDDNPVGSQSENFIKQVIDGNSGGTVISGDNSVNVVIAEDSFEGEAELSIIKLSTEESPPMGDEAIGSPYLIELEGADLKKDVELRFNLSSMQKSGLKNEVEQSRVVYWSEEKESWVEVAQEINEESNEIIVKTNGFSIWRSIQFPKFSTPKVVKWRLNNLPSKSSFRDRSHLEKVITNSLEIWEVETKRAGLTFEKATDSDEIDLQFEFDKVGGFRSAIDFLRNGRTGGYFHFEVLESGKKVKTITINDDVYWGYIGATDFLFEEWFEPLFLHEVGHAIGLTHPCTLFCEGKKSEAIMWKDISDVMTPQSYDIDEFRSIYDVTLSSPEVTTNKVKSITKNSALSGGNITDNGGEDVTTRGICWSQTDLPNLDDFCSNSGSGLGNFESELNDLKSDTKYYVRAFATNSIGTSFGQQEGFQTEKEVINKEPSVEIINGPQNGSTIGFNNPRFQWNGEDEDGEIEEYEIELDGPVTDDRTIDRTSYIYEGLVNGDYEFHVRSVDNEGAKSVWATREFSVEVEEENIQPTVQITGGPSDGEVLDYDDPRFEWDGEDEDGSISIYNVELNGPSGKELDTDVPSYSFKDLANGEYEFRVQAVDNEGAKSSWATREFSVEVEEENIQPTVEITGGPSDGEEIDYNDPRFEWEGDDEDGSISIYNVELNGPSGKEFNTDVPYYPFKDLANGDYEFRVQAVDNKGAKSSWASREFTVDVNDTGFVTTGDYARTNNPYDDSSDWDQIVEDVIGSDYRVADWNDLVAFYESDRSGFINMMDELLGGSGQGTLGYVTRDGDRTYSSDRWYFATRHNGDKPGSFLAHENIENYLVSLGSWDGNNRILAIKKSSNQPPSVEIVNGPQDGSTIDFDDPGFVWEGDDPDGSIQEYEVELNGPSSESFTTSDTQYLSEGLANGDYEFRVRAVDNDGAKSSWDSREFTVEVPQNETPKIEITGGPGNENTIDYNNPEFTWSGNDPDGEVEEYDVELIGPKNESFTTSKEVYQFEDLPNGDYEFRVRSVDNEGAKSSWASREFSVDVNTDIPNEGLIAYYPFNGDTKDESQNSNNGTNFKANLTNDRFGNSNSAYSFNGLDSYIKLPVLFDKDDDSFAISFWIKPEKDAGSIFGQFSDSHYSTNHFITISDYYLRQDEFPPESGSFVSNNKVTDKKWTHIVVLRNQSERSVYINGQLDKTDSLGENYTGSSPDFATIGVRFYDGEIYVPKGYSFEGVIDEMRFYNKVLSEEEINTLFQEE